MLSRLFVLLTVLLLGCSDYSMEKSEDSNVIVYPETIDFGTLLSGYENRTEEFIVINSGTDELEIRGIGLTIEEENFELNISTGESHIVKPNSLKEFEVKYEPETYEENYSSIEIFTNHIDEPNYEIGIMGNGAAPVISITPKEYSFGENSIGCEEQTTLTIRNTGNIDLEIHNIIQTVTQPIDISLNLGSMAPFPWTLEPGEEIDIYIELFSSDLIADTNILTIISNDPLNPEVDAKQISASDSNEPHTQTHIQSNTEPLDLLFVVDNSGSMFHIHQQLASQMTSFMEDFLDRGVDYHIGVITTDSPLLQEFDSINYIDTNYIHPVEWMESVLNNMGAQGYGIEKGLDQMKAATETTLQNGFWRDEAIFAVVYVSDEEDQSVHYPSHYTMHLNSIKTDPALIRQYAVTGDIPTGCSYSTGSMTVYAQPGYGYNDIVQDFNGNIYSICALDWGIQMRDLAENILGRRVFSLEKENPILDTIEVKINGQITDKWAYDAANNSVVMDLNAIPQAGQTLEITYRVWNCEE